MRNDAKRKYITKRGKIRKLTTKIKKSTFCWEVDFLFNGFITEDEINERISQLVQQYRSERKEKQPRVERVWKRGKDGKMHLTVWLIKVE